MISSRLATFSFHVFISGVAWHFLQFLKRRGSLARKPLWIAIKVRCGPSVAVYKKPRIGSFLWILHPALVEFVVHPEHPFKAVVDGVHAEGLKAWVLHTNLNGLATNLQGRFFAVASLMLRADGRRYSKAHIMRRFGVSRQTLYKFIKQSGITEELKPSSALDSIT